MLRFRQPLIKTDVVQQPTTDKAGYVAILRNFGGAQTLTQQPQVFSQVNRVNYLGKDLSFLWTGSNINRDSVGELPDPVGSVNYGSIFVKSTERGLTLSTTPTTGNISLQLRNQQSVAYTSNPRTIRTPGSNFTIGTVFKVKDTVSSVIPVFDVTNSGSWYHAINFSSGARVSIDFAASGGVATNLLSDNTYAIGEWLSVVVVFKSGDTHFYVNGVKQTQVSTATLATTGLERIILTPTKTDILTCFTSRAVWDENMVQSWTKNPWQVFRSQQPHFVVAPEIDEPKKLWGAVRKNSVSVNAFERKAPQINRQSSLTRDLAVLGLGGRPNVYQMTFINGYTNQINIAQEGNAAAWGNNELVLDSKYGYGFKVVDGVSWGSSGSVGLTLPTAVEAANDSGRGITMMYIGTVNNAQPTGATNEYTLISYGPSVDTSNTRLQILNNRSNVKNKLATWVYAKSSPAVFATSSTVDFPIGKPVCIIVTHNKTQGQKLYLDGKLVAQQNTTTNVDIFQYSNSANTINIRAGSQGSNDGTYIAAVWNRALTDTEIQSVYENPHQLYQQPHQTWYTAGVLDTRPIENIGFRNNRTSNNQPRTQVQINWASPFSKDLQAAFVPSNITNSIGYREVISGVVDSYSAIYRPTKLGVGPAGLAWQSDRYTAHGIKFDLTGKPTGATPLTVFCLYEQLDTVTSGNIIRAGSSGTYGAGFAKNGDGTIIARLDSNNTGGPTSPVLNTNQVYAICTIHNRATGYRELFVDGQSVGSATGGGIINLSGLSYFGSEYGGNNSTNRAIRIYCAMVWTRQLTSEEILAISRNPWQLLQQEHKQFYYYTKPDPVSGNVAKLPRPTVQYKAQPLNIATVDRSNYFGRDCTFLWSAANPQHDATGNFLTTGINNTLANITSEPPNITHTSEGSIYTSSPTPIGSGTGGGIVFTAYGGTKAFRTPSSNWTVIVLARYVSTAQNLRTVVANNLAQTANHLYGVNINGNPRFQTSASSGQTPNNVQTNTTPYTLNKIHLTMYVCRTDGANIYVDGNLVATTTNSHVDSMTIARLAITTQGIQPIMVSVIDKGLNQDEVKLFGQNPWQLYKQTQQHLFYSPKPEPQPYVLRIPHTKQLAQPQTQATSNIDWGNPLSRGLLGSFTPLAQYNTSNEPAIVQGSTITTQYSPSGAVWRNTQLATATNYIKIPRGRFNYTTAVTYELVFKLNSAVYQSSPTRVPGLISQWQYVGGADARGPKLSMIHQFGGLGRLQFSVPVGTSTIRTITQPSPYLEPEKTYHVVATFAPSSPTAATLNLYVNGQLSVSGNPFTGVFVNDANNFISLMSDYVDNSATNPSADIDLYLARVYNVAKTATEVRELYRNPWQLYQTPKSTFAISQQIKPLELATITSRRPYRQQPQAALSVDTGQTSFAKLLFCLIPQNNRFRDIGPRRVVSTVAASNQTGVITGHDAYGHFVHNPYGTQIDVGNIFPTFDNSALLDKTYTVLISFLVESNVASELIISTMRPASGAGFSLTTKDNFDGFRQNSFRVNCNGLNAETYSAYVDGRPFETRTSSQLLYTTFTREYNKLHTVAATFKTSNINTMMEHYLGNMASAGTASVASRYYLYTWWEGRLPDAMLKSLSENPWQIFEQNKKYSYFAGEYPSAVAPPEPPPLVLNSRFLLFFG